MQERDWRDVAAGGMMIVIGASVTLYSVLDFKLGTLSRMGPGMFPAGVGGLLIVLGLATLLPALRRKGEELEPDIWAAAVILTGISAFALLLVPFGLFPSIIVSTLIVSRADGSLSLWRAIGLAVFLSALIALIFLVGLGVQVRFITWPW